MAGYEREERKESIIRAAAFTFASKGYAGTSMAEIARAAGIGKGTTYEYFKSKDDLFLAVFEWFVHRIEVSAGLRLSSLTLKSAAEKLTAFSESILLSLKTTEELYPLVLEFWAASVSSAYRERIQQAFKEVYKRFSAVLYSIISEGIERGEFSGAIDPESTAPAIVGAWDAMGLQAWFNDAFDIDKTMADFTDLVIRGLLKRE